MTGLVDMLVPAIALSGLAIACLALLPNAPSGVRFWIAVAGLAAWLVPWPLVKIALPYDGATISWIAPVTSLRATAAALAAVPTPNSPGASLIAWLSGAAFAVGIAWFGVDCARMRAATRTWRLKSSDGWALRTLLPAHMNDTHADIRIVAGSPFAAASGWLRPTIWVGSELGDTDTVRVALLHECWHVRRRDPLRIWLLTAVRRAYWWNPLVAKLASQAMLMVEAGCDQCCALEIGTNRYVERLGRMMLAASGERALPMTAAAGTRSSNLLRLNLLTRETRMRTRDYWLLGALAAAGLALTACRSVEPSNTAAPPSPGFALTADQVKVVADAEGAAWQLTGNVRLRPPAGDIKVLSDRMSVQRPDSIVLSGNVTIMFDLGDLVTDEATIRTLDGRPLGEVNDRSFFDSGGSIELVNAMFTGAGNGNIEVTMASGRFVDAYR